MRFRLDVISLVAVLLFGSCAAVAGQSVGPVPMVAELSARTVTTILFQSKPGERPDLSDKFLAYLDLSNLNFKGAILTRSDFYGTDFTGANLSGADLSYTRLDRSVLIRANLSGANLTGATIYRPTIYSNMQNNTSDAPRFSGANLTHVHVQADLSGSNFRGADLTEADFFPLESRPGQGTMVTLAKNVLKYCDFSGANLHNADMRRSVMWFAKFTGADLTGARFNEADLSSANFAGADLAGANFTHADLDGANFVGAKDLDKAIGLDKAINLDKAFR